MGGPLDMMEPCRSIRGRPEFLVHHPRQLRQSPNVVGTGRRGDIGKLFDPADKGSSSSSRFFFQNVLSLVGIIRFNGGGFGFGRRSL